MARAIKGRGLDKWPAAAPIVAFARELAREMDAHGAAPYPDQLFSEYGAMMEELRQWSALMASRSPLDSMDNPRDSAPPDCPRDRVPMQLAVRGWVCPQCSLAALDRTRRDPHDS